VRDVFARAIACLALGGVFILYAYRDHGVHYVFDVVLAIFWTAMGTYYLILDLFGTKDK
jgi:hypothetical protein